MTERPIVSVSKTEVWETIPGVRIPPSPLFLSLLFYHIFFVINTLQIIGDSCFTFGLNQ